MYLQVQVDLKRGKIMFIWVLSIFLSLASLSSTLVLTDNYHINCGSTTNISIGNRIFTPDPTDSDDIVRAYNGKTEGMSFSIDVLYQTAAIFTNTKFYTFPIARFGRHLLRFYFSVSPFTFQSYDKSRANFLVHTQNHVLLSYSGVSNDTTCVKEFLILVETTDLVITFAPLAGSFAFLNALELVSLPDELITDDDMSLLRVDVSENFNAMSMKSLETVARVNMGGLRVSFENDLFWRTWDSDQSYLLNNKFARNISKLNAIMYSKLRTETLYSAPSLVYATATAMSPDFNQSNVNLTWEFNVEKGFRYLVRFHFCDIVSQVLDTLYFNVYIDSWKVASNLDLSSLTYHSIATPLYRDYVTVLAVSDKVRVSIGPSDLPTIMPNAILNGIEIMKINNSKGSLSVVDFPIVSSHSSLKKSKGTELAICASIGSFFLVALALVFYSVLMCKRRSKTTFTTALDHETRIPFLEILAATDSFEESQVIGTGGFGKVYKGVLKDGTKVAVKRKNTGSQQGLGEFLTEIKMLSTFRHRHLVSLVGYCDEENEMILVYEYVQNGTLRSHLCGSECSYLTWKQRLEICIGAARGLHYLHTGFDNAIIHRDVKSVNILIDENLRAKVADFGISKIGPDMSKANHVSTTVKGSFGYFDPEYFRKRQLSVKSDVYSFGVVLFEVLCGRPALDSTRPTEEIGLAGWAMRWRRIGKLEDIMDTCLVGQVSAKSLEIFGDIAEKCLAEYGVNRPSRVRFCGNWNFPAKSMKPIQ